ncbi:MAG: hypothetical protein HPY69_18280 [Armatimonadetes bacterium]|nr:hypothetical protein [Armatimonadota bacterium]
MSSVDFWMSLWTLVWFASLGVFSVLSILVIWFGGSDLLALLGALRARHMAAEAAGSKED